MRIRHEWHCAHSARKARYRCRYCWRQYWHCVVCESEAARYGAGEICAECYWRHGGKLPRAVVVARSPVGEVFRA